MNEYQVVLKSCEAKLGVIKALKIALYIGLNESKELTDSLPCVVMTTSDKSQAENLKAAINVVGGVAVVEGGPKGSSLQNKKVLTPTSVVDILIKYHNIWQSDIEDGFFAVCPVPEKLSAEAREHFNMGRDESVLFYYQNWGIFAGQRSFTAITDMESMDNSIQMISPHLSHGLTLKRCSIKSSI